MLRIEPAVRSRPFGLPSLTPPRLAALRAALALPVDQVARPRGLDPADAGRRMTVIDKYRKGEKTGAEHDEQASGAVSNAVK